MKTRLKTYLNLVAGIAAALIASTLTAAAADADIYKALITREFGTAMEEIAAVEKEIKYAAKEQYPEIESKLLAVLNAPEATMAGKQFVCQMLQVVGSSKCIRSVSRLLTDEKLSHMARNVFQGMRDPAVDRSLRAALEQTQGNLRIGIVNTIGDRADRRAVRAIAALVNNADNPTAAAALNALGKIGGPEAANALAAAKVPESLKLTWGDAFLRCAGSLTASDAARASRMCRSLFEEENPVSIRAGALTTLAQVEKEQAVPLIVKTLGTTDPKLRRVALGAVLSVPGNAATKALTREAEALPPEQKAVLIGGLASRGDAAGVAEMVNKLASDENALVRTAAIKALGKLGDASSVPVLTAALKDRETSPVASQALIELSGTGVAEALVRQTQASDATTQVALLNVLTERREYEALPVARRALHGDAPNTRRAALRTVAVLGTREDLVSLTQLVLNSKDPAERDDLVQAMSEVGGRLNDKDARLEPVLQAWSKADAATKVPLLTVLWSFGGEKALETVRGALGANADLHKAAVKVLGDWPDHAPMPDLLKLAREDKEPSLRILALRGYIKMAGQPGTRTDTKLENYKTAFELATRPDEKRLVLTGLADVSRVGALKVVETCLEDAVLQKEAYFAYEKIAESLAGKEPAVAKEALLKVAEKATDEGLRNKARNAAEKIK